MLYTIILYTIFPALEAGIDPEWVHVRAWAPPCTPPVNTSLSGTGMDNCSSVNELLKVSNNSCKFISLLVQPIVDIKANELGYCSGVKLGAFFS